MGVLKRRDVIKHASAVLWLSGFEGRVSAATSASPAQQDTIELLVCVARDLYPHDALSDADYWRAVSAALYPVHSTRPSMHPIVRQIKALDARSVRILGRHYYLLPNGTDRVALLAGEETQAWFVWLRKALRSQLYDDKKVWPKLGYEGSSFDKGGYLNRGFNDLKWL